MEEQVSKIERLDIAAKAIIATNALHFEQGWLLFLAAMCTLLGTISLASWMETLAIRAAAGTCIVLLLLFLFEWRYAFHAYLLASVGATITAYWIHSKLYPHSSWLEIALIPCFFLSMAARALPWAVPFATAHKKDWEEERRAAQKLYEVLLGGPGPGEDCWISAGNFWVGYFTYRLVRLEDYWAVAKFKREKYHKMLEFRVLEKDAVRVTQPAGAELDLYITGKKIRNAKVGPESYEKLMRLAVRSSPT